MNPIDEPAGPKPATSGTASWERAGAETEHEALAQFLENVAEMESIQTAISRAADLLQLKPGDRVLDAGCGTGVFFPAVARLVGPTGQITGLDHASGFLTDAAKRAEESGFGDQVRLVQGDLHCLPFPDGHFDAAHTERVLIHVADPDLAIRELRRVVKPGGRIVCVEPDLVGMRMDHVDPASAAAIIRGFCATISHPAMGLELNRRFAAAGLVERQVETVTEIERQLLDDDVPFFRHAAERAVAEGWLTAESAASALQAAQDANTQGAYTSYSSMFIVAGRVPA